MATRENSTYDGEAGNAEERTNMHNEDFVDMPTSADTTEGGRHRSKTTSHTGENRLYSLIPGDADNTCGDCDENYTIPEALHAVGFGPFQYRLLFVMCLVAVAGGMSFTGIVLFPSLARCHLKLSSAQEALITSIGTIGYGVGGACMGFVATKFGRRMALLFTCAWTAYYGMLSGVADGFYWLVFLRFMVGFGRGGTSQRMSLIVENVATRYRTLITSLMTLCYGGGHLLETVIIKFLIPTGIHMSWRYVLLTDSGVFLIILFFQKWIYESPFWLLSIRHDRGKALLSLERASKMNARPLPPGRLVTEEERERITRGSQEQDAQTIAKMEQLKLDAESRQSCLPCKGGLWDLFRPGYTLRTTVLLTFVHLGINVSRTSINILIEEVLQARKTQGGNITDSLQIYHGDQCGHLTSHDYTPVIIIFASELLSVFLTYAMASILGRRLSLVVAFIATGVCLGNLLIQSLSMAMTVFFLAGARLMMTVVWGVSKVYTAEVYPTYLRSMAVGLSSVQACLGGFMSPFLAQVLFRYSMAASKGLHAAICILAGFLCLLLPVETKLRDLKEW